jgi:two-component sensor histidine kinase
MLAMPAKADSLLVDQNPGRLVGDYINYPMESRNPGAKAALTRVKLTETGSRPAGTAIERPPAGAPCVIPRLGLASIGRMSTSVASLAYRESWLTRIREQNIFSGLGYTTLVTLVLMVGWDLDGTLSLYLQYGFADTVYRLGKFFLVMMVHQLPMVPVLTIAVNVVPDSGPKRYVLLGLVAFAMWGFCTLFFFLEGEGSANSEYAGMVVFIVIACVYRSSARSATEMYTQRQIEGAALDADVKRARLQLLRAQIEPHFLFNTLATVRTLARANRAAAVDMIDHLMRYLSEALPKLRQEECCLAEERQLIDAYLRIHQIRMGSRLSYELHIPESLQHQRVPTMILLTLVENAVKHGINPAVEGGHVTVSAGHDHGVLLLKVSDSGQGLAVTDGHGMGLANIRRRLMMLYGDDAVLSLARSDARGVTATVSIPLPAGV